MKKAKEALVLIPGLEPAQKYGYRERLVQGLAKVTEISRVQIEGECSVPGEKGIRLQVRADNTSIHEKTLDVYEAYWVDLVGRQDVEKPVKKMIAGFSLLTYWFFSRIWRVVWSSKYMTLGILLSSLLLLAWYYGVLALAFTAIGSDPELTNKLAEISKDPNVANRLLEAGIAAVKSMDKDMVTTVRGIMGHVGEAMGGWYVWAIVSMLMGFLPVNKLVGIATFTMRYLRNDRMPDGIGQRDKIRNRVLETLMPVLNEAKYKRVTVIGHSFGTVIGTDIMADFKPPPNLPVRYVTMGSPLLFLSRRSKWLEQELKKCLVNDSLESWIDYYADEDWMCAKVPGHGETKNQKSNKFVREATFKEKILGETHEAYYSSQEVMEALVS